MEDIQWQLFLHEICSENPSHLGLYCIVLFIAEQCNVLRNLKKRLAQLEASYLSFFLTSIYLRSIYLISIYLTSICAFILHHGSKFHGT